MDTYKVHWSRGVKRYARKVKARSGDEAIAKLAATLRRSSKNAYTRNYARVDYAIKVGG